MYCPHCGAVIADSAKFCPKCGKSIVPKKEPIVTDEELRDREKEIIREKEQEEKTKEKKDKKEKDKKKKKGRKKWIVIAILIVIVLLAIGAAVLYFTSPAKKVMRELDDEAYTDACDTYNDSVAGNFLWVKLTDPQVIDLIGDLEEDYEEGSVSQEEAVEILEVLADFDSDAIEDAAEEAIDAIEEMQASADIYAEAEELYEQGEYIEAMDVYAEISEDAAEYEAAQSRIDECETLYIAEVLERTASPETQSEYETAITLVEVALGVFPDDEDLQTRLSDLTDAYYALVKSDAMTTANDAIEDGDYDAAIDAIDDALDILGSDDELTSLRASTVSAYESAVKSEAITTANDAIDDGDYEAAIDAIDDALDILGSDSDLTSLRESAVSAYEDAVVSQVEELTEDNDYDTALELISAALKVIPESTTLSELYDTTEENQPVKLADLKLSESDGQVEIVTGQIVTMDTLGNTYSSGNLYMFNGDGYGYDTGYSSHDQYVKYYLGGEYTTLIFTLAVADENEDNKDARSLTIYGNDDEILYTSGDLTRTSVPTEITVDVTGTDWLYIKVDWEGDGVTLLVADPILYK